MSDFAQHVLAWYDQSGHKALPWKANSIPAAQRPYRIWLSEIMLQQTQVATVLPYYQSFIQRFPTLETLAHSSQDDVLGLWSGLGYYARGRNLHKAAQIMWQEYKAIPDDFEKLLALPGIGRSTAGAVMAQAFHQPYAILDGNVKRVLARYHAVDGWPGQSSVAKLLWQHAESHTPKERVADYTQAIMNFGSKLCTRAQPKCIECTLISECNAYQNNTIDQFPASKPKKKKPVKQTHLLCVLNSDQVLLQQRPPAGIWGGLWSFPEFESKDAMIDHLELPQANIEDLCTLESFRHSFSHYHLDIHPHVLSGLDKLSSSNVQDSSSRFFSLHKKPEVGIAAPVQRILHDLKKIEI